MMIRERMITPSIKRTLILVMVAGFAVNVLLLTSPLYMLQMYDRVLTSRSIATLAALSVIALFLFIGYGFLEVIRSRLMIDISTEIDERLNEVLFDSVFREALVFQKTGAQSVRDLETLRSVIAGHALISLFDLPWAPFFIALIFVMHPILGGVAFAGAGVTLFLAILSERMTRPKVADTSKLQIRASRFIDSCLRNVDAIHSMGMTPAIRARWLNDYSHSVRLGAETAEQITSFSGSGKALRIILQSTILGTGAWLVLQGGVTPGVMVAASIIFGRAIGPLEHSIAASKGLLSAKLAMQRLDSLLVKHGTVNEQMQLPAPKGELQVEGLYLIPPGSQKPVLQNVSFQLHQGEVLVVVGSSASGKSSLAKALVGLWTPARGIVRIDGASLHQWDPIQLGNHIGFVPQDVELLEGTVKENISRFKDIDADSIVEAANYASCHQMILGLPNGYDFKLGEGGGSLSAGQSQRVALARSFYGNPSLVVLDEPDANLDLEGKSALEKAIVSMKQKGVTIVIITHNIRLMRYADKALMLSGGMLSFFGKPVELLQKLKAGSAS